MKKYVYERGMTVGCANCGFFNIIVRIPRPDLEDEAAVIDVTINTANGVANVQFDDPAQFMMIAKAFTVDQDMTEKIGVACELEEQYGALKAAMDPDALMDEMLMSTLTSMQRTKLDLAKKGIPEQHTKIDEDGKEVTDGSEQPDVHDGDDGEGSAG